MQIREFKSEKVPPPEGIQNFSLPKAFSASKTFIDLEIGCGVGLHPIRYAQQNPSRFLIAIEHTKDKFGKFQNRIRNHPEIKNILPVQTDAIAYVTHHLKSKSIDRIFLLYPNPEPNNPNKRWFRMPFMAKLLEVLKPGGRITLATNDKSYFAEALTYGEGIWSLALDEILTIDLKSNPNFKARTHFEKKYLDRGEICYQFQMTKKREAR